MALEPGTQLGPYEILAPLGAGAMGEVYRARDPRLDREVAIKVLPDEMAQPERLRRFEQEARAAGTLKHSNVLTIHDIGSHEGRPYIVAELLEGRTLREHMAGAALPVPEAVGCAVQIARGLSAAHHKGIVHRDLKPENVFLTNEGELKILDFGLAKVTEANRPILESATTETRGLQTQAGTVMGTLGYMSPEQVRGEVVDHRTDLFALGVMLYEMVAGKRPFVGQSAADTISAILTHEPPRLSATKSDVPPVLDGVIRRCLAKRREDRFSGARDVALALESLSEPVAAGAVGKARGAWWLGAAAALVALALAAAWSLWGSLPGSSGPPGAPASGPAIQSLAVLPLDNRSGDSELDYFSNGMTEALITDLGRIRSLRIVSHTSAMRYKDSQQTAAEIAKELGVDALVRGSVLSDGGRVRITARLVDGTTDEHLWGESYERELKNVLALQSEVARRIAAEVDASLTPAEEERLTRQREVDPEAYDAYLRGDYPLYADTPASADAIVATLKRAIELDPGFAPAHARLADFYGFLSMRGRMDPAESYMEARRLAGRAVELDPELAVAWAVLGRIHYQYDWDWVAAEREFLRALELNPNDVLTLALYGAYQVMVRADCDAGLDVLERSVERDPFNYSLSFDLGVYAHYCRLYEESIRHLERAAELAPGLPLVQLFVAWNDSSMNRHEEALSSCQEILDRLDGGFDPMVLTMCGAAHARAGHEEKARGFLDQLRKPPAGAAVDSSWAAFVCTALGDEECALDLFEKAFEERSSNMVFLRMSPLVDSLRGLPRFRTLLERMDFPT